MFGTNVRSALRQAKKRPGLFLVAILTLAIGVGLNSAMFSVVDALFLEPLPFPSGNRLVRVFELDRGRVGGGALRIGPSYPDFLDWQARNRVFSSVAAYEDTAFDVTGEAKPLHLEGEFVSSELFGVLGVQPTLGRDFLSGEEGQNPNVAIISHSLWSSRFHSDSTILGKTIQLEGRAYAVAGVMPGSFRFPLEQTAAAVWVLINPARGGNPHRGSHHFQAIARLKNGVTVTEAVADMNHIARALALSYPATNAHLDETEVIPERELLLGSARKALEVLYLATFVVLLIACANVAGLSLTAALSREREIAVRLALGARRRHIAGQLLTESLVLSAGGAGMGLLVLFVSLAVLRSMAPVLILRLHPLSAGLPVIAYAALIAVATSLLFGIVPALMAARSDPYVLLHDARDPTSTVHQSRASGVFVIGETALALALTVCSGLLIRSFLRLSNVNLGFDPKNVLTFSVDLPEGYTSQQRTNLYVSLFQRLSLLPDVTGAGGVFPLPLSSGRASVPFKVFGESLASGDWPDVDVRSVSPGYFKTLAIPLLEGRLLNWHDNDETKSVVIINEAFARRYFPGRDPVGQLIDTGLDQDGRAREIVGVVGNAREQNLTSERIPELYVPHAQAPFGDLVFLVRLNRRSGGLLPAIRAALDHDLPIYNVQTMERYVARLTGRSLFSMLLLTFFAGVALALAAIGLYGVVSFWVGMRTKEIGIRMAMGARRTDIVRMVLRAGLSLTAAGLALGLGMAAILTKLLSGLLFNIRPLDPVALLVAVATLTAISFIAALIPALRAAAVDPARALRSE
ncbi:MAG: ABC transporter permease [Terriglobia bacterium]